MKMIDVLKRELKEGMSINTEKEMCSKWKATISYDGMQSTVDLPKVCTPGCEKEVCRKAIDTALSTMYVNVGNLAEAKRWLDGEFWKEKENNDYKRANNDTWICNQLEELVNALGEDRERIALQIPETIDYYSFLNGFDYVLDKIKYILYE